MFRQIDMRLHPQIIHPDLDLIAARNAARVDVQEKAHRSAPELYC